MKEMSLKEIQQVSLGVMKEFHEFCQSHNLRYSLAFGTMIGSVRHRGFIPWDDDIDVYMPRPDFIKLLELYKDSDNFSLISYEKSSAYQAIARLCDMKHTVVRTAVPWCNTETGVWIDIFPLDGVEADLSMLKMREKKLKDIWRWEKISRRANAKLNSSFNFEQNFKIIIAKLLGLFIGYNPCKYIAKRLKEAMRYDWEHSRYVSNVSHYAYPIKELWPKEYLEHTKLLDFEDTKFCVFTGYDFILKSIYGDYMKLPPKEKQIVRHVANCYYFK